MGFYVDFITTDILTHFHFLILNLRSDIQICCCTNNLRDCDYVFPIKIVSENQYWILILIFINQNRM